MTWCPELGNTDHDRGYWQPNAKYVGWLDPHKEWPRRGYTTPEFQDRLLAICVHALAAEVHMGPHFCQFCTHDHASGNMTFLIERAGGGIRYHFPELLAHYVIQHGYKPPQEFIDAVMANEPIPLSAEKMRDVLAGKYRPPNPEQPEPPPDLPPEEVMRRFREHKNE